MSLPGLVYRDVFFAHETGALSVSQESVYVESGGGHEIVVCSAPAPDGAQAVTRREYDKLTKARAARDAAEAKVAARAEKDHYAAKARVAIKLTALGLDEEDLAALGITTQEPGGRG